MYSEEQREIACEEFQAMLVDVLDGVLPGAQRAAFEAHRRTCPDCAPLSGEAEAGRRWLRMLQAEEVIPPPQLLEDLLRATSRAARPVPRQSWRRRLSLTPELVLVWRTVSQPRFAMGFAMVFFCFAALLSVTGVKLSGLRAADLRPSALVRDGYALGGRAVSYYDNLRWVYEVESRVRELRQLGTPEEDAPRGPESPSAPRPKSDSHEQPNPRSQQRESKPARVLTAAVPLPDALLPEADMGPYKHRRWL
jgi:hypothetical protein